ncbi:MAG: CARDB domain-containing protein [Gemmataceae bacterium]
MKRLRILACLTMLGLGVAGAATYVWGQTPTPPVPAPVTDAPLPIPAPMPPTLPAPAEVKPVVPPITPMGAPTPMEKPGTLPAPVSPITPNLPVKPTISLPGEHPVTPVAPMPGGITLPAAGPGEEKPAPQPEPQQLRTAGDEGAANNDNPTGRQEPAVSLEWIGPPAAKVGQPADYSIVVRNVCNIPVQQVLVRVRMPQGLNVVATEPKAVTEESVLMWDVGTLLPKQERNLQMKLVSPTRGDIGCQAWVTFTGASAMKIRVREPKLLIKASGPEKVLVGDACTFVLTVSNPGDHPAEQVKIHAELSEGLESVRGPKVDFDIGPLGAGETRSVQVLCATKTGGDQKCEAIAEAADGLKAADKAAVSVMMPRIDLEVLGPKLRYLDRKATYKFKVTNPGDAPAANVTVSDLVPPGFKFLTATEGGRHDFSTRTVTWFLGEIGPGQSREVLMEVLCVNKGVHNHKVTTTASRGLKLEQEVTTKVEGLSAIALEMIDLDDPVEVGADETYEIRITNTGTQTETDVKLICTIPDKMTFKNATGPTKFTQTGNEIVFEPIARLAPRADAIFRVTVKCNTPGVVNFKSRITSTLLVEPVHKEEATRIYSD